MFLWHLHCMFMWKILLLASSVTFLFICNNSWCYTPHVFSWQYGKLGSEPQLELSFLRLSTSLLPNTESADTTKLVKFMGLLRCLRSYLVIRNAKSGMISQAACVVRLGFGVPMSVLKQTEKEQQEYYISLMFMDTKNCAEIFLVKYLNYKLLLI